MGFIQYFFAPKGKFADDAAEFNKKAEAAFIQVGAEVANSFGELQDETYDLALKLSQKLSHELYIQPHLRQKDEQITTSVTQRQRR